MLYIGWMTYLYLFQCPWMSFCLTCLLYLFGSHRFPACTILSRFYYLWWYKRACHNLKFKKFKWVSLWVFQIFVMSNLWLDTLRPSSPKIPHLFALLPAVSVHSQTFIHTWKPKLTHSQFTLAAHLPLRYFTAGMMISFGGELPTMLIAIMEILASEYVIEVL